MKGIIFKKEMFDLVVMQSKTQTRRIIKPQPDFLSDNYKWAKKGNGDVILPRYGFGESVYIKEPFHNPDDFPIYYKYEKSAEWNGKVKWQNPRTMAARQARYFIEITGVRCETVQEISDADCKAEGIICDSSGVNFRFYYKGAKYTYPTPRDAYAALFDKINGKGSFEKNVWVWVYDFKLVKTNK